MNRIKKFIVKYGSSIAAFAFALNVLAIHPGCRFLFNEPEMPDELAQLLNK